jgi:MYXO-CTERM domain-containing protein
VKRSLALLVAMAWTSQAAASTSFPQQVDDHLKLTGAATIERAVAPPDGCLLCHQTELGGFGTNNAFGARLRQNGAVGAEPSTVGAALDALDRMDPRAIDDIMTGINPNDDPEDDVPPLPQPSYGCTMSGGAAAGDEAWAAALLAIAVLATSRRRPHRSA